MVVFSIWDQNGGDLKRCFPVSEETLTDVFLVMQRRLQVGTNTLGDVIRGGTLNGSDVNRGVLYRSSPSPDIFLFVFVFLLSVCAIFIQESVGFRFRAP